MKPLFLALALLGATEGCEDEGQRHRTCWLRKVRPDGLVCLEPQGTAVLPLARRLVPRGRRLSEES